MWEEYQTWWNWLTPTCVCPVLCSQLPSHRFLSPLGPHRPHPRSASPHVKRTKPKCHCPTCPQAHSPATVLSKAKDKTQSSLDRSCQEEELLQPKGQEETPVAVLPVCIWFLRPVPLQVHYYQAHRRLHPHGHLPYSHNASAEGQFHRSTAPLGPA